MNISGFTIEDATANGNAGIYFNGGNFCNIFHNNITNNCYGIYLYHHSSNNTIEDCNLTSNRWTGIYSYGYGHSDKNTGNTIKNNTLNSNIGYGIHLLIYSDNSVIRGNNLNGTAFGVRIDYFSDNNDITENVIAATAYGIQISYNTCKGNNLEKHALQQRD